MIGYWKNPRESGKTCPPRRAIQEERTGPKPQPKEEISIRCTQYTTFAADGTALERQTELPVTREADEPTHLESGVINLYPRLAFQTIEGFGTAMTESAAYLLSRMDPGARRRLLLDYFGPEGNHTRFIRVPIDSCDYSLEEYAAVADPLADPELKTFSIQRDRQYILPMLKEVLALADQPISVLMSPWSPPAAWKTPPEKPQNDLSVYGNLLGLQIAPVDWSQPSRCHGGSLKPEYYGAWARYLAKYIRAYLDEGIPVTMMTLQNESIAATDWDSCVWTAPQQKTFLRDYLYPEFQKSGLTHKVGPYIWDHNKERVLEYAAEILDEVTDRMVEGIAFHWYSGDHFEAVEMTRQQFPGKVLLSSECCTLHPPGKEGFLSFFDTGKTPGTVDCEDAVAYAHDLIGNLNAGMNRWIDWNLILDENGGPRHVPGGFASPVIANGDGSCRETLIFAYIRHFAHYILPRAVRVGFSRCDAHVEVTAARNPDGSLAVVVLNPSDTDRKYAFRLEGQVIRMRAPGRTISTFVITP